MRRSNAAAWRFELAFQLHYALGDFCPLIQWSQRSQVVKTSSGHGDWVQEIDYGTIALERNSHER
jgi:hypothetical protein